MKVDNIVNSTLKVTANENLHIDDDLQKVESEKTLEQLVNEQETKQEESNIRE